MRTGRSVFFGDASSIRSWQNDPKVQIHGPGWSKVILGEDAAANWEKYIDVIATSIAENGGRSCLNASSVFGLHHTDAKSQKRSHNDLHRLNRDIR